MSLFDDNSYTYLAHQQVLRDTWGMSDDAMGRYLRGMLAGSMGLPTDNLDEVGRKGWGVGNAGREKSMDLRERKAAGGRKSAEARREAKGTAQPPRQDSSEESSEESSSSVPKSVRGNDADSSNLGRKEGRKEEEQEQNSLCENAARDAREARPGTRRIWPNRFVYTSKPDRNSFIEACKERFPKWQPEFVAAVWDAWHRNGWKVPTGSDKVLRPIGNWAIMAEIWYKNADETEKFKKEPIGSALQAAAPDLSGMRFVP